MAHFGASCQRPLNAIAAQATLQVNIGGLCSADAVCAILNALTMLYVREKLPLKPSAIGSEGVGDLQTALQRMSRFDVQQNLQSECEDFVIFSRRFSREFAEQCEPQNGSQGRCSSRTPAFGSASREKG